MLSCAVSHQFRQDRAHPLLINSIIREEKKSKVLASGACINPMVTNTPNVCLFRRHV